MRWEGDVDNDVGWPLCLWLALQQMHATVAAEIDAPVWTMGAVNLPAVPLNVELEKMMLPSAEKVEKALSELLNY